MENLTVLGSTGSIGVSTLDVVGRSPGKYRVYALVAGRNVDLLVEQIHRFSPSVVVVATGEVRDELAQRLVDSGKDRRSWPELAAGPRASVAAATASEVNFVMSAIVGVAGLEATYEAIRHRKRIGLANKEVLVASGQLVMDAAREFGAELLPVDSEHNGAHQAFRAGKRSEVTRLLLTASGGPFRETPRERFDRITPAEALNHPTWKMGQRITIDSATLMNKGFEVIEACWLFQLPPDRVEVVVHPQSSIHAMVEYTDGSVIAQISATDMRMPIQYALTYPDREESPVERLDWTLPRSWSFFAPDLEKFPCLRLAYQAQRQGGSAACTLNAADEVAVEAFLRQQICFADIPRVIQETLDRVPVTAPRSVAEVLEIDRQSRSVAARIVREQLVKA